MNDKLKDISIWTSRLLWPTLLVISWWSVRIDTSILYLLLVIFLVLSSILFAWWQKRLYLAAVSLVFIGTSGLFVYLQTTGADNFNLIASYLVLIYLFTVACFASFLTYTLKVQKPNILVYLVCVVFICTELFWLLSSVAADPIIKAVLVTGLFHIIFSLVALFSWGKLAKTSFRWYLVGATVFFVVFIRLL